MKSVCSIHEQAYDVGEHCPYCEEPAATVDERGGLHLTVPVGYFNWSGYASALKAYTCTDHQWVPLASRMIFECRFCRAEKP